MMTGKKLIGLLRSVDFLGSPVALSVKGSASVKTIFGSVLSIVYMVGLVLGFSVLFNDYLDKSKPSVMNYIKENSEYPVIDLYREAIIPPVAVFDALTLNASGDGA